MLLRRIPFLILTLLLGTSVRGQDIARVGQILFVADRDGNSEVYVMDSDGSNQTRLTNDAANEQHPAWSPTGAQILFSTDRDGNFEIYLADDEGSNEVNLSNDASTDESPAWSPDGSRIIFQTDRDGDYEIYAMDPDGSNLTNLTNDASVDKHPRWSPDGTQIVFQTMRDGNWEIYAMDADGSNPVNLSSNAAADERPNWSPDGTEIVFDTDRDGNVEIYLMDSDGTGQTNLTNDAGDDVEPSWSADGTRVSFRADRDGDNEVYIMDNDGTDQTRLSNDAGSDDQAAWFELKALAKTVVGFPALRQFKLQNLGGVALNVSSITSSDGQFFPDPSSGSVAAVSDVVLTIEFDPTSAGTFATTITIVSDDPDDPTINMIVHGIGVGEPELQVAGDVLFTTDRDGDNEIYVLDLDGTGQIRLTNDAGSDEGASFSPDGGQVVWQTDRDGDANVYLMDGDGSNPIALTSNVATDGEPSFSPDGSQIAFSTDRDGNFEIYTMFSDGNSQINITSDAGNDRHPRWSPDGSKIIFQTDRDGNEEIYSMDPDGSNPTNLTNDAGSDEVARFSPDGTQIAFSADRDGDFELYVMDADGSNQTQLTNNAATEYSPVWSPDGTRLMFTSDRLGDFDIYSIDSGQGKLFRLTSDVAADVDPDFSQVRLIGFAEVAASQVRSVFVQNRGNTTLTVSSITSSDAQFTLSVSSVAIAAFDETQVDVTFTPTSVGFFTSTLTIVSDDPVTPTATLLMNGSGFTPDPDLLILTDLVYMSDRDGNEEIYVQDLESPAEVRLTNDAGTDTDPHVSPEGARIVFSTDRDGNFEIYVTDADGSNPTRLTNDAGTDAFPAWAPTGIQIVFQTNRDGNEEIYRMDDDGSNPTNLTNDAGGDLHPRWSPDGLQIVFHSNRDGNNEIYVMEPDGSNPTRLTNDAGSDREPDWSPDGGQIAFVSDRDGNFEIYVMDADGTNQTRLTNDAGTDESPTWSPDGTKIAYRSDRDGDGEIWITDSDGTAEFPFVQNTDNEGLPSWGNYRLIAESPVGVPVTRALRIFNPGVGDLTVSSILSSDPQFTFSPSSFVLADGDGQTVAVTFGPTSSTTTYSLFTITSDDTDAPTVKLTANATGLSSGGLPVVVVDGSLVDFDSTLVGTTATLPIAVKNQGAGLLSVTSVAVAGNAYALSTNGPEMVVVGDSLVIDVDYSPVAIGLLLGEVSIFHDDGTVASPIVISLRGSGVDAIPVPSFSELDFGEVESHSGKTIQLVLTNVGNIPVLIHDVEPDSGIYKGEPDSIEVGIGLAHGVVDLTFSPDTSLSFADTLRIYHNGSSSPLEIPLSGVGVPEPPPPEPILAFGLVDLGFGPTQLGGTGQVALEILNSGDDTLRVTGISSDVAGLAFSTTVFDLPPGADTSVAVDVSPPIAGFFEGTISVTHNGSDSPSTIAIDGEAVVPVVGFVEGSVDFGPVQVDTSPELAATLVNDSPSDLNVTGVGVDGPFTTDTGPFTLAPGEEKTIPISFSPGATGLAEGVLCLFHDDPFVGLLEILLTAEVLGTAFETGPNELFLVDPGAGKTVRDALSFTNLTDSTLAVSAEVTDGRFTVGPTEAEILPGVTQNFVVTYTSDGSGKTMADLILSHNSPGSPPVFVPLLVEGGKAEIVFGNDNLQFETVDVGDTSSAVLAITNPGSDTLFVNGVEGLQGQPGRFQIEPSLFAIASGESLDVMVRFIPDGPGSFADFLAFDANVGLGEEMPIVPGVSAIGVGRGPDIAVAPDRLFFATQDAGTPDSQTVVVTNIGNDTLRVLSLGTLTSFFDTDTEPFTLAEGESEKLLVIYTPDSTVSRLDTLLLTTNAQDTVRVPLLASEIPRNIGKATLSLSRLDTLMSPQVGDTISLALDLKPGGDVVTGADVFVGIPSAFFISVDPASPFLREGLIEAALVLVNDLEEDADRDLLIAILSTSLFTPRTANGVLARLDLIVIAPLEGPAPVAVLSEFPVHNSQYLVSSPPGTAFTFQASEPEAFGNLPPRFLSLPLLQAEEDGSTQLFMNSRVIDPDGPLSEITFTFEPSDSLLGVAIQTLLDTLVTAVFFPPPDANGIFPVTIVATDAGGASDTSVVLIEVAPVNDPPTVVTDTVLVRGGGFVRIPLLDRASDIDGDSLSVSSVTAATNGTVVLNEDQTATYTPEDDFNGESSFSYVVVDGNDGSVTGTMVLTVSGTNAGPVIGDLPPLSGVVDSPFAFVLTEFKSDPDDPSEVLAWAVNVLSGPAESARVDGDLLEVFPLPGRIGEVRILLALFDPFGTLDARDVTVLIEPRTRIGDLNGDFEVDFFDLLILSAAWASAAGDPGYVPLADLDSNGEIGFPDFQMFAVVFGTDF